MSFIDDDPADPADETLYEEMPGRWVDIEKLILRGGPLASELHQAIPEVVNFIRNDCKILVIGAGGLGCELLKDLALMGFRQIHVIDMDTIDLSNLNRQFLFRHKDIGRPKAVVAAEFINRRIEGANVTAYANRIEDFDADFYRQFMIVVCGLDSIVARRWINSMLHSLVEYDSEGNLDDATSIPLVDGGTEGFKGSALVVRPGKTACIECTLDLYPPQVNFPMCTIAQTPRLPEHCIEYIKLIVWPKERPNEKIDGDDPDHIKWICDKAAARAAEFKIAGVDYRLTQGVIKNIIPAVASTNAVVAAITANEVFKLATGVSPALNNYVMFNDVESVYTHVFEAERKPTCLVCSGKPQVFQCSPLQTVAGLIDSLKTDAMLQMRAPGIATLRPDGSNFSIYYHNPPGLEQALRKHLDMTLEALGIVNGQELNVTDPSTSVPFRIIIQYA